MQVECAATEFVAVATKQNWRDEICELASFGNEAVQNQLERAYGERPAVLCAFAEKASGSWKRESKIKEK